MTVKEFRQLVGGVEYYNVSKFVSPEYAEEIGTFWAYEMERFDDWTLEYFQPEEDCSIYMEVEEENG